MNAIITTISLVSVVVGVVGIVPQLVAMLRTHTASGQSMLGWSLSGTAAFGLAFLNLFAYNAPVLALGNILTLSGCLAAMVLIRLYRGNVPADARPVTTFTELHTQEFVALHDAVLAEHHRRAVARQHAAIKEQTGEHKFGPVMPAAFDHHLTPVPAPSFAPKVVPPPVFERAEAPAEYEHQSGPSTGELQLVGA